MSDGSRFLKYLTWTLSIDCSSLFFQDIVMKCTNTMHVKSWKFSAFIPAGRGAIRNFSWQQILWIMQGFYLAMKGSVRLSKWPGTCWGHLGCHKSCSETFPFSGNAARSRTQSTFQPIWQQGKEGALYTKLKKSSCCGWERCQRIPEPTFYT